MNRKNRRYFGRGSVPRQRVATVAKVRTHLGRDADQSDDPVFCEITFLLRDLGWGFRFRPLPPARRIPLGRRNLSRLRTKNSKDLILTILALSVDSYNNRTKPVFARGTSHLNEPRSDLPIYLLVYVSAGSRDFLFFAAGHFEWVRVNESRV